MIRTLTAVFFFGIVTSYVCQATSFSQGTCTLTYQTQTTTSSCNLQDGQSYVMLNLGHEETPNYIAAIIYGELGIVANGQYSQTASYGAQVSDTASYISAGPVRAGYISMSFLNLDFQTGSVLTSVTDGTNTYALGNCAFHDDLNCTYGPGGGPVLAEQHPNPVVLPFELGVPFTASASAVGSASIFDQGGLAPADMSELSFQLYEADGTTAVADTLLTPEPSSALLSGVGLGALWLRRRETIQFLRR